MSGIPLARSAFQSAFLSTESKANVNESDVQWTTELQVDGLFKLNLGAPGNALHWHIDVLGSVLGQGEFG